MVAKKGQHGQVVGFRNNLALRLLLLLTFLKDDGIGDGFYDGIQISH